MRKVKDIALRMLPVILVCIVTVILSEHLYRRMMLREEQGCWSELQAATNEVAKEIDLSFNNNLSMLDLAADAVVLQADTDNRASVLKYLSTVKNQTFFERIDIIFPNSEILLLNGESVSEESLAPFEELSARGAFVSERRTDPHTGNPVFYYFTPVESNGAVEGMLIGVIDCEKLGDLFVSEHYKNQSHLFMVDRRDGNFLINNWHENLGTIYDVSGPESYDGVGKDDFIDRVMKGETIKSSFKSRINNQRSFMFYTPVGDYPFSVSLFVQEDIVFEDVNELNDRLMVVGVVEVVLMLLIFVYTFYVATVLEDHREKVIRAEIEKDKTEAKTVFLSSVSHDIRTPLNGIIGMLDVINLNGDIPEHMRDPLKKIDVSAKHLLSLASDVLDLNALETGKIVYESEPVDLLEIMRSIGTIMQSRADEKNIKYHLDYSRLTNSHILGSGVHLNKVLANLVSNAIKYNKDNGDIWLTAEQDEIRDGESVYRFIVRDNGVGISEEFKKNIFNAFEQENAGARSSQTGHGLGLSIVHRLVCDMRGTIEVESEKNVGTTFTVTLPLRIDGNAGEREKKETEHTDLTGASILLVEDNELNMEIARILLSNEGATVTPAGNGRIAVELYEKSQPYEFDIVLMDIMMPEMDGHEACRAIRNMDRADAKNVPIIAMTANTFSEDIKKCRESGMDEHIGKPIEISSVTSKVAKHIEKFRKMKSEAE